ncbi:hypothetical protein JA1_001109 [Spathaspora sp. JA1]|nr:hypothetical protein JA1_001109 [Spathaspora sp. JA1]
MNTKNTILPPANGKKLWRVKRASSNEDTDEASQTSMECLKSSLKISAAAAATAIQGKNSGRRHSLKRPKNVPGKPKNFVFVDLSPVKSEVSDNNIEVTTGEDDSETVQQLPSPQSSDRDSQVFDAIQSDDSLSSVGSGSPTFSADDSGFFSDAASPELPQNNMLGLGITGMDFNLPSEVTQSSESYPNHIISQQLFGYQKAMIQQHYQIQFLQSQLQEQQRKQMQLQNQQMQQELARLAMLSPFQQFQPQMPFPLTTTSTCESNVKVAKRKSEKRRSSDQFKSYNGPSKRSRSISEGCIKKTKHSKSSESRSTSISTVPTMSVSWFTDTPFSSVDSTIENIPSSTTESIAPFLSFDGGLDSTMAFAPSSTYTDFAEHFGIKDFNASLLDGCGSDPVLVNSQDVTDLQQLVPI